MDRIDPARYPQFRTPYHAPALAAMEPLRKALGYEPRIEVLPDRQHVSLANRATWDHRVTVPPGSFLWAFSGSSAQAEGYTVQVSDLLTRRTMFSGPLTLSNVTGQGTATVLNSAGQAISIQTPLQLLPIPRPVQYMNVQLANLSAVANVVQFVLWIWQPPPADAPQNEWNAELAHQVARWQADGTAGSMTSTDALRSPAYNRTFNTNAASNEIIPAAAGLRIAIHQLSVYNTTEQTIEYTDGTDDLRGPLIDLGVGGTDYLPYQEEPHFVLTDGRPFVIFVSPSTGSIGPVTGFVKYRFLKAAWTPGQ